MSYITKPVVLPRQVMKGEEIVVVPRKECEGLLKFYNVQRSEKTATKRKKRRDGRLTKGLREALDDVKAGRISKGFDDVDEMMKELLS